MIMAIPPYISLLGSTPPNPGYSCSGKTQCDVTDMSKPQMTALPKKRSFDVAFLISQDEKEKRPESNEGTIRSAFRKVGMGLGKLPGPESRSPSPVDPTRTPSPYDLCEPHKKQDNISKDLPFGFHTRGRFQDTRKDHDKSHMFLGGGLVSPVSVGVGLARGGFLPTPIFSPSQLLPTSFVTAASLLPPSLAALSLPAQNVCAKCNVSFRMTSDLVYHMRSHHKNEHSTPDQLRRRRELDKLKCPVCNESFRERHHLTRHMTAHQDKEGDNIEAPSYH